MASVNVPVDIHNNRPVKQSHYDYYNGLLFSDDRNILFKMVTRIDLFNHIKDIPGDIVECGVFKGAGMALWLKLLDMHSPHDIRKVIGFDFFDQNFVDDIKDGIDRNAMKQVFSRCPDLQREDISVEGIVAKFKQAGVPAIKYELVKGDIARTSKDYAAERPGFRISILYLDLDLDEPTYQCLCNLWDRVVPGGIVVFDEYGYHIWSESNAVDRFVKEKGLRLIKTDVQSPTAWVMK
jgi:hypothetical protein